MNTKVIRIRPQGIEKDKLETILRVVRGGGIAVFPTETFYALVGDALSVDAVKEIFALKRRDPSKPLPLVVSDPEVLREVVAEIPPIARRLMSAFWPGPLTLVFQGIPGLPEEIKGPEGSIAVRLTSHAWLRSVAGSIRSPLTATSANLSGKSPIVRPEEAVEVFSGRVALIVDGGRTEGGRPSTILDVREETPRLIREGAVSLARIHEALRTSP